MEENNYKELEIEKIESISEKQRQKMLAKSAYSLPNNTSLANLKAEVVKGKFHEFVLDKEDSIYSFINELINKINDLFLNVKEKINQEALNFINSILELQKNKQDNLTFDNAATSGSLNPVTSDGILRSILDKVLKDVEFNEFKPVFVLKDGTRIEAEKSLRGEQGVGIDSISSGETVASDEYTTTIVALTKTDGTVCNFDLKVKNGKQGIQGKRGAPFEISKTYRSIEEMELGYAADNLELGKLVAIVSNTEDVDNAKIYVKGETEYEFLIDLSGAKGIQGEQGVGIESITMNEDYTMSIQLTNGNVFRTESIRGEQGDIGPQGPAGEPGTEILVGGVKQSSFNADIKQEALVSGDNIKTINNQSILGSGNLDIKSFSGNYNDLTNKPSIVRYTDYLLWQGESAMVIADDVDPGVNYSWLVAEVLIYRDGVRVPIRVPFFVYSLYDISSPAYYHKDQDVDGYIRVIGYYDSNEGNTYLEALYEQVDSNDVHHYTLLSIVRIWSIMEGN